jgi:hypothetical protein
MYTYPVKAPDRQQMFIDAYLLFGVSEMREFTDKFYNWLLGGTVGPWVLIVLAYIWAWPIGIILTLMKCEVIDFRKWFSSGSTVNRSGAAPTGGGELRKDKYKVVSQGMTFVSIDYLAKVVGVDFATAIRDIQERVLDGAFGPEAYIDYERRWLVKSARTAAGQTPQHKTQTPQQTQTPKTAHNVQTAPAAKKQGTDKFDIYGKQTWMLVLGIILAVIGGLSMLGGIDDLMYGINSLSDILFASGMIAAGGSLLGVRHFRKRRVRRFASYMPIIGTRSSVSISELASAAGVKESTVRKDLEIMMDNKLLGDTAYLDVGAGRLVMFHDESENVEVDAEEPKNRYDAIIAEIHKLNDDIADEAVSEKIDKIETLTKKIFRIVEDKPEKLPEIKSFMSYYLPTTLKLLRSYSDFERQGVSGENINATKERIEKILDTLVSGFSQQLDQLFKTDAMDISSDIDVLETMMKKDGLSKDESGFQVGQAGV